MPIKGVWRVPKTLSGGTVRHYYYTSRSGGVLFWQCDGAPLDGKRLPLEFITAYENATRLERPRADGSFQRAVEDYRRRSPKFLRMSPKGRRARIRYLDAWQDMPLKGGRRAGLAPLAVLDQRGVIPYILAYRTARWGQSPSTADEAIFALSAFLRWAKSEGRLDWNRCEGLPGLYQPRPEARVWSAAEQEAFLASAPWPLSAFFRLALFTGLRLGDLVRLPLSAVTADHIILPTSKSGGRNTAIIPIIAPLRELLAEIEDHREKLGAKPATLLFNSWGRPWTADGLKTSFYRHREAALSGDKPSIHDLRKTAATNMVILQKTFPEISDGVLCDLFGWTPGTVSRMKRIYVSDAAVIRAMTGRN
jgi:integrase